MRNDWKKQFEEVVFERQDVVPFNYNYVEKNWREHVTEARSFSPLMDFICFP